jgi:hypothetical protein
MIVISCAGQVDRDVNKVVEPRRPPADGAYVVLMPVQHPSRLRPLRPDELTIEGAELELKLD